MSLYLLRANGTGVNADAWREQPERLCGSRRNEGCVSASLGTVSVLFISVDPSPRLLFPLCPLCLLTSPPVLKSAPTPSSFPANVWSNEGESGGGWTPQYPCNAAFYYHKHHLVVCYLTLHDAGIIQRSAAPPTRGRRRDQPHWTIVSFEIHARTKRNLVMLIRVKD